jgi:heat shock protein HtpX
VSLHGAAPWCPACGNGLELFDPEENEVVGWRWLDRGLYSLAYRETHEEFELLANHPVPDKGPAGARIGVLAISAVLHLAVLACLVGGLWLCVQEFPSLWILPGAILVLIAIELRPRFGRVEGKAVTRSEAPTLYAFVDRVAAAVGAPPPHVIVVDEDYNASAGTVGIGRRRVLTLGLPLWGSLDPQGRVALLGHELGHFVNGDVRRTLLTQPVYTTLPAVMHFLSPSQGSGAEGIISWLGGWVWRVVAAGLRSVVQVAWLTLLRLAQRDAQRAEYLADSMAARVGGSAAALQLLDLLQLDDAVLVELRRAARRKEPASMWPELAARAVAEVADTMPLRRQLSIRTDVSLTASHPPTALRSRLLGTRPRVGSEVPLDAHTAGLIEAELATRYEDCVRSLALQ